MKIQKKIQKSWVLQSWGVTIPPPTKSLNFPSGLQNLGEMVNIVQVMQNFFGVYNEYNALFSNWNS